MLEAISQFHINVAKHTSCQAHDRLMLAIIHNFHNHYYKLHFCNFSMEWNFIPFHHSLPWASSPVLGKILSIWLELSQFSFSREFQCTFSLALENIWSIWLEPSIWLELSQDAWLYAMSGWQRQGKQRIGCLLRTQVVMWVLHFNPVELRICCKIAKLAGSISKARAGQLKNIRLIASVQLSPSR